MKMNRLALCLCAVLCLAIVAIVILTNTEQPFTLIDTPAKDKNFQTNVLCSKSVIESSTSTQNVLFRENATAPIISLATAQLIHANPLLHPCPPPALTLMAWIYPGNPACNAPSEYRDGRKIDVLKSEFFTIADGQLTLLTATSDFCNGYSAENIQDLKKYSTEQYATISSGSAYNMNTFLATALSPSGNDIPTLVNFTLTNTIAGIELDFEDFSDWSPESYVKYKQFVTALGTALHSKGKKLLLVGPAVANAREEKWFLWRYNDFVSLPADTIVVMAYDNQYDTGAGYPITPLDWLTQVIVWTSSYYPKEKITIGLPSYGYEATVGTFNSRILTAAEIKTKPGFKTAIRDRNSGEMTWTEGNTVYFYQDTESLDQKRDRATSLGITSLSIWHLGGNPWF